MTVKNSSFPSEHYRKATKESWTSHFDAENKSSLSHLVECLDINQGFPPRSKGARWAFIGLVCEDDRGANALRRSLADLPAPDIENTKFYDLGDLTYSKENIEKGKESLCTLIKEASKAGLCLIALGGSREIALAEYKGIKSAYPKAECAVACFDSRLPSNSTCETPSKKMSCTSCSSLSDTEGNHHECIFFGVQQLKIGSLLTDESTDESSDLQPQVIFADEFHIGGIEASIEAADNLIIRSNIIYLSISLDVFAAPFAPGVISPQPLGLLPWHVIPALRRLAESNKVALLAVSELWPETDRDDRTAGLGASLIADFINHS